ncbi:TolC family outer membrane protein [Fodinicurvata fenggangensis]|uniref:TolC family outer membrane protein n=1 Tax=Fodinicurvata fenggangensis TaxID=1121830 RepID=UPI0009DE10A6|nr:TolC family outer membrane protein [Fodinicurvata fenggangensis]
MKANSMPMNRLPIPSPLPSCEAVGPIRKVLRASLLASGLLLTAATGGQAQEFQLLDALENAYESNPRLKAARAELGAVNERVPQALSGWRPTVQVTASAGKERSFSEGGGFSAGAGGNSGRIQETTTPRQGAIEIVQPLYRGGRTVAGTERAENEVRAQRFRLENTEQTVLLDAVTAYMDVWRDMAEVRLNENNESRLARQLEATRQRFEVGEITRTDVAQAESRLAGARAERIAAEGRLNSSRAVFREVIGREAAEDLSAPEAVEGMPESLSTAIALAEESNPSLQAAQFDERAAERQVREREGELLPEIQLRGRLSAGRETSFAGSKNEAASLMAEVTIPIYQAGLVSSQVREAKQVENQRRLEGEVSRRNVRQETVTAWEEWTSSQAQITSLQAQIEAAEVALEGVQQENAVGARTLLDVLDQEQELLDAQVSLVRARREDIVASFRLLSAIGRLTAEELGLDVAYYEPEEDYRAVRDSWFGLSTPSE